MQGLQVLWTSDPFGQGHRGSQMVEGKLQSSGEQAELVENWELGKILPASEVPQFVCVLDSLGIFKKIPMSRQPSSLLSYPLSHNLWGVDTGINVFQVS